MKRMPHKFDVVMSTFQSGHKLEECLDSVIREIPVNKIIVVDGGSTDGTLEILKRYPQVELYVRPDLNLGQSREFAFSKVTTEWFVQIDSDFVLRKGWLKEMMKSADKGDIIEGGAVDHYPPIPYPNTNQNSRALFGNCFIRTEAVKGVKLNCRHLEDELTRRYAESHGYKLYKTGCILADHYSNPVRYRDEKYKLVVIRKTFPDWMAVDEGKVDAMSGITLPYTIVIFFIKIVNTTLGSLSQLVHDWKRIFLYFKGYLAGRKAGVIVNKDSKMGIKAILLRKGLIRRK